MLNKARWQNLPTLTLKMVGPDRFSFPENTLFGFNSLTQKVIEQ